MPIKSMMNEFGIYGRQHTTSAVFDNIDRFAANGDSLFHFPVFVQDTLLNGMRFFKKKSLHLNSFFFHYSNLSN